jgi:hypothetical protein
VSADAPRLPDGFVDPLDRDQVTAVLAAVRASLDQRGLLDLLARLPGLTVDPGRPGKLLRAAVAPSITGGDDVVRLATPVIREHVVGGVVLSRTPVPASGLATVLAGMVCRAVRRDGTQRRPHRRARRGRALVQAQRGSVSGSTSVGLLIT